MKKVYASIVLMCLGIVSAVAQSTLSAELLKNPSFEEEMRSIRNRRFGPNGEGELFGGYLPEGYIPGWFIINHEEAPSKIEITTDKLLNKSQQKALRWSITEATEATPAIMINAGSQGIEMTAGKHYTLTFWARADKRYKGQLRVGLFDRRTGEWCAQAMVKGKVKKRWKRYSIPFVAHKEHEKARFVITADRSGTLYFDEVSLTVAE